MFIILAIATLVARNIDLAPYKPQIEAAALESGIRLRIDGDMYLSLLPYPGIEVNEVYLDLGPRNRLTMDVLSVQFAMWPLLNKEFRITKILLKRPVAKLAQLSMSFPKSRVSIAGNKQASTGFGITVAKDAQIVFRSGEITYKKIGSPWYVKAEDVAMKMWFRANKISDSDSLDLDELRPAGRLSARLVRGMQAVAENVKARIKIEKGKMEVSDIAGELFGGKLSANIRLKDMASTLSGALDLQLTDIDIAKSTVNLENSQLLGGRLTLNSRLSWKDTKLPKMLRTLQGEVNLGGRDLQLRGLDIDKALERIEKARRFNLTDLGAFFYLGPLGAVATKGYAYVELLQTRDNPPGKIIRLVSNWTIDKGRATATDVALATPINRLAIKGQVNLVSAQFENLAFSVVDEKGCGIMGQEINGPFSKPTSSKLRKIRSMGEPFRDALRQPARILSRDNCKVFYSGSLPHPGDVEP